MNNKLFFIPSPLFKEFKLLDIIEKKPSVTQRILSELIGSSVSMINSYIEDYEKKGYLKRIYMSNKNLEYIITNKGIERKKLLNIEYLKSSHAIFLSAKENILIFLNKVVNKGFNNILLYGAGDVAELLLLVVNDNTNVLPITVLGIVDDDVSKHGKILLNYPIISNTNIKEIEHDGILISNYKNRELIYDKLIRIGYRKQNVLMFFENFEI